MRYIQTQAGLTLIELVVVIAIFMVVASVLMFNYGAFTTNVSVRNLAQDVALAIRKAQTYATSARISDTGSFNTNSFPGYGIAFSTSADAVSFGPYQKQFVLFADIPNGTGSGDKLYQSGSGCGLPTAGSECAELSTITTADKIKSLCTDTGGCTHTEVNVLFRRPVPDADICVVDTGGCQSTKPSWLDVTLESLQGQTKTIRIWNTGQISVQ